MVAKQADDEVREIVGLLFPIDCDWTGHPPGASPRRSCASTTP